MSFIVAIDGPSCVGKSTIAKILAEELDFSYFQSGSLYRCVAFQMKKEGLTTEDEKDIQQMLTDMHIQFRNTKEGQIVLLNGENVTTIIRSKEVTDFSSKVASIQLVRDSVDRKLRRLAYDTNIIMDGRDIGTTLFPNADIKFFLTAHPSVRAKRKQKELAQNGEYQSYEAILESMYIWDYDAIHRKHGALRRAPDSIGIDTSDLTIEELKGIMLEKISQRIQEKEKRESEEKEIWMK